MSMAGSHPESHPELFRAEDWSPPRGAKTATWAATMAGAFFGPFVSGALGGASGIDLGRELPFLALFVGCAFAATWLQSLVLRRGGAAARMRWFESDVMRVFGAIDTKGSTVERNHFALAGAVPAALFALLVAAYLAVSPEALGVVAAVLVGGGLGGSVKPLLYTALALRRPPGTLVEELEDGALRFHRPTFARL